ncbi:MAG: hypothetical protein NC200_01845 [Candidatus Gastranaerophilales bacterium]|nr:hypothetical protein [Candidatus Gastranaerophilales bacterium]
MQRTSAIERNKKPVGTLEIPDDFAKYYLSKKDRQMRFCNAKDPIYHVFASIDRRPLGELFRGFVRESVKDSKKFLKQLVA